MHFSNYVKITKQKMAWGLLWYQLPTVRAECSIFVWRGSPKKVQSGKNIWEEKF